VLSEEDFDKVRPESTRVIDLVQFADDSAIDPMYIDRAYYLAPDGKMAGDAFAVMREGMKGKVGIGKLALYGREYLVAVRPQERGIVMYTLHHAAEIRSIDTVDELNSVATTVKPEEMKLAQQVIATFEGPLDLANYKDEYREGLQRIIEAKIAGEEIVPPAVETPPRVVNLMEALKKSLDNRKLRSCVFIETIHGAGTERGAAGLVRVSSSKGEQFKSSPSSGRSSRGVGASAASARGC
jgi:DNA end-binding protein Ku